MDNAEDLKRPVQLPADCSIGAIRGVYEMVRDAFRRESAVEIDCSSVDKADVTSVQLLLSTAKTATLEGRPLVLTALSPSLRTTFERAGLPDETMSVQGSSQQNNPQQ
ncbi:anti-anti-sigma regulatory factor [Nitrobacteraceae bacterium AZCC 1564]